MALLSNCCIAHCVNFVVLCSLLVPLTTSRRSKAIQVLFHSPKMPNPKHKKTQKMPNENNKTQQKNTQKLQQKKPNQPLSPPPSLSLSLSLFVCVFVCVCVVSHSQESKNEIKRFYYPDGAPMSPNTHQRELVCVCSCVVCVFLFCCFCCFFVVFCCFLLLLLLLLLFCIIVLVMPFICK